MTCLKCKAVILHNDQSTDGFHEACYRKWIAELYEELRGLRVKKVAA